MRVGAIGDTHLEAVHPGYLAFCSDVFDAWDCRTFVHLGDVADMHGPSMHDRYPGYPGPKLEFEAAKTALSKWVRRFPEVYVCIGNHDERVLKLASRYGMAEEFVQPFATVWGTPGWSWKLEHIVDDVFYTHGTGKGGERPAFNVLRKGIGMSIVMGHNHTKAGISVQTGPRTRWWAMDVGCGVDRLHPAMQYARDIALKEVLACAVVVDGHPYLELMPCGPGEKYHRSRFKRRGRR